MITVNGRAKINLTLDILGRRADGYHEVEMIMQSVALHDTVELTKIPAGIELHINVPWLKADSSNLAWRAAALMQEEFGLKEGVALRLTKRIPVAAGLAGGSTDAAAVLRGMVELFSLDVSTERLCELGARLGSDIPFTLLGGTMLASGRGEQLTRLADFPTTYVVLAKPHLSVSTAWAYQTYDRAPAIAHPDNVKMRAAIARGNRQEAASLLCNVLESVTITKYPVIKVLKEKMKQAGALASMMSGSGPTVFALAEDEAAAERIAAAVRQSDVDVFITQTTSAEME